MGKEDEIVLEGTAEADHRGSRRNPKVVWIGGDHPRHLFFANHLHVNYGLEAAVIQKREEMVPFAPTGLPAHDVGNWHTHFHGRINAETHHFGTPGYPDVPSLAVDKGDLNTPETAEFVDRYKPDVVFIFGCGMIRGDLYDALPRDTINLHLGLSPRYRGAATQFWPFYFLEPQWAGATFHRIVSEPDAGAVLHQVVPSMSAADGIHDVACKTVVTAARAAYMLIRHWPKWTFVSQKSTGKNFLVSDFKPEMLRLIYEVYNNCMVDDYLNGSLSGGRHPTLVSAF